MFTTYFQLGVEHITDLDGYDHLLFITALLAPFLYKEIKKTLLLVTAFTIGHSITLGLAAFKVIPINSTLVEFLIPITILITALSNLINKNSQKSIKLNYGLALGFGLIHGMGFSNFFQSLLGKDASVFQPLFAFNLGVEVGQILFVILLFVIQYVLLAFLKLKFNWWRLGISIIATILSLQLIIKNIILIA